MGLKTIKNVPIVSTGTYKLGSGETTFTKDHLASAVLAASDPTVRAPRIKIGHEDKRFPAGDGQPAAGSVRNMALDAKGETIIGDLVDVPDWLAAKIHSAYPARSIEGGFNYSAPSGHDYKLVISNLSLLGETWPGVTSMDDLREVMERNGEIEPVAAEGAPIEFSKGRAEKFVMAKVAGDTDGDLNDIVDEKSLVAAIKAADDNNDRAAIIKAAGRLGLSSKVPATWNADGSIKAPVKAALDIGGIPRRFAADLKAGKLPKLSPQAWARSVEAGDDGALALVVDEGEKLTRLPITVADTDVTYGEPTAVAASNGSLTGEFKGPRVLASWPSPSSREVKTMKVGNVEVDQAVVAKSLGLADDADEATIVKKLKGEDVAASSEEPSSLTLPDGVVAIDKEKLAELEEKANAGANVAAKQAKSERDETITGAIKGGRIAAAQREHFSTLWDKDPEGVEKLLTAKVEEGGLAAVIPAEAREVGVAGDGDDPAILASMPRLLPELNETEVAA
jgi:hypothetical protein